MKLNSLILLVSLISGSLIGITSAHAGPTGPNPAGIIGPKPFVATALAKGTLFAAPTGSGTTCSLALPCSIWTVISKAKSGSVVFLRGGTYAVHKNLTFSNVASAGNPIIYENYPGEIAVFDGSEYLKGTAIYIRVTGKFIKLRGIEVKNMPMQGIWINGTDNEIDGVHSHHNGLSGIQIYSPYDAFPYDRYGSRNVIRNCTINDNSDAGVSTGELANGGNADGISVSSGADNRVENCLVYQNSDDGIDTWRSTGTYVGYSISYGNGIADGDGNGIKAGGASPSRDTVVERSLSHSNKAAGLDYNAGSNVTFTNNTTWNNGTGYVYASDTTLAHNIISETKKSGTGIEVDNSWQRSGKVTFISTDPKSTNFLVPSIGKGFEDIGAFSK